jgi:hypothetical protein
LNVWEELYYCKKIGEASNTISFGMKNSYSIPGRDRYFLFADMFRRTLSPNHPLKRYRKFFSLENCGRREKLTIHLHAKPRLGLDAAVRNYLFKVEQ